MGRRIGSKNTPPGGRYREDGQWRFDSLSSIEDWGGRYGGYAVLHRPTGMLDDHLYYTWHRTHRGAKMELKSIGGLIRDEEVIVLVKVPKFMVRR